MTYLTAFLLITVSAVVLILKIWRERRMKTEKPKDRRRVLKQAADFSAPIPVEVLRAATMTGSEAMPISSGSEIMFNYNGHSWNACEVLEIEHLSDEKLVEKAYAEALQKVDPQSRDFVSAAYRAIREIKGWS